MRHLILPRVLSPSGVCIRWSDILAGFKAAMQGEDALRLFRDEICRYFGVRHAFLVSSGRAALSVLLTALQAQCQCPEKDTVLIPGYTSFSVPSAVVNAGFKVSLYDLDGVTLSPNQQSLLHSINERTLCIVACHLYGYPCDMDSIKEIAASLEIPVIDDAAQAMGATYKGAYVGTLGTAGLFSLSRGKNITAVDGGVIVTDDDRLAAILGKINLPKPTGQDCILTIIKAFMLSILLYPWIYWLPQRLAFLKLGASAFAPEFSKKQLLPFQAGIGQEMLGRLATINIKRGAIARALQDRLNKAVTFIRPVTGAEPVYLRLPILCSTHTTQAHHELGVVRSYPLPLDAVAELQLYLASQGKNPVAKILAEQILTLPTHEFVIDSDIDAIVKSLSKI